MLVNATMSRLKLAVSNPAAATDLFFHLSPRALVDQNLRRAGPVVTI
ncbi:MAG TPA: hypothetical protein VJ715_15005 [Pyrinomonadaceae bacterium]|nr:hypothetical protein [Pyrinomonadaceae bacterium]